MYMKLKDGKSKVVTLSYDDGVVQDIRLMDIMDKYGIRGTFNISSGCYFPDDGVRDRYYGRMTRSESKELYIGSGHEVAVHAFDHPRLEHLKPEEVVAQILDDRRDIERTYKTITRGMAYPYGSYNDQVVKCLEMCGICYARTTKSTENFEFPPNWLTWHATCHHKNPRLMELAKNFAEKPCKSNTPNNLMFYLWGHSYEFDDRDNWNVIEEFCEYMGGRDDIWYATNIEIYDYVMAYNSLQADADRRRIYNPNAIDVWFAQGDETYCIKGGETIAI